MKTCKDCLHFKVCEYEGVYFEDVAIETTTGNDIEDLCPLFENKADFVEAKHGVWIEVNQTGKNSRHIKYTTKQCSVCGYWNGRRKTNYCPHCGAKMDGGT